MSCFNLPKSNTKRHFEIRLLESANMPIHKKQQSNAMTVTANVDQQKSRITLSAAGSKLSSWN